MDKYLQTVLLTFFVALGVSLGGSLTGALGALLARRPPGSTMVELAKELKLWALVAALGGTFSLIRSFEAGFFGRHFTDVLKQLLLLLCAFGGAHLGYVIILSLGAKH